MKNAPDLTLSPSEKRTLQRLAANDGAQASELDWVALQRLKKHGLAEDRASGVRITAEGRRLLRRLMPLQ
jgi:ribosomal protein S19E (S16A)